MSEPKWPHPREPTDCLDEARGRRRLSMDLGSYGSRGWTGTGSSSREAFAQRRSLTGCLDPTLYELFSIVTSGVQGVVAATKESNVVGRARPAFGERDLVMVLQPTAFGATTPVRTDERALPAVALEDLSFDVIGDVPGRLEPLFGLLRGVPWTLSSPVLAFVFCQYQLVEGCFEQLGQVAGRVLVTHQVLGHLDFSA